LIPNLHIRHAVVADTAAIEAMLREAAEWVDALGVVMWEAGELVSERIASEVAAGQFVIAESHGEAAGALRFQMEDLLFWPDIPQQESAFVHRLVVRRRFKGQGISIELLRWAVDRARELGKQHLRLDCDESRPKCARYTRASAFVCTAFGRSAHITWHAMSTTCRMSRSIGLSRLVGGGWWLWVVEERHVTRDELLLVMRGNRYAIEATVTRTGAPQAAVIGIAVTDAFEIVFDTLGGSRKAQEPARQSTGCARARRLAQRRRADDSVRRVGRRADRRGAAAPERHLLRRLPRRPRAPEMAGHDVFPRDAGMVALQQLQRESAGDSWSSTREI
jgi:GNAT superfamily N-acetyltransferase